MLSSVGENTTTTQTPNCENALGMFEKLHSNLLKVTFTPPMSIVKFHKISLWARGNILYNFNQYESMKNLVKFQKILK